MKKTLLATALALTCSAAMAAPVPFTNDGAANFTMYDPTGAVNGNFNDITGFVDYDNMTFGVASASPFFGLPWTASGGTMFGPGTYNIDTADPAPGASGGIYTGVTVGAGQMGGHIDFAWGTTSGIDVVMVWDVTDNGDGTSTFTSSDWNGDGIPGAGMIDGPFPGFSANFNFVAPNAAVIPVPAAVWLLGSGLIGLVGVARRKKAA